MLVARPCPDVLELERYLVGLTPDPEASLIDDHISSCECCARAADAFSGSDELADAVRSAARIIPRMPTNDVTRRLVARVNQLYDDASAATLAATSCADRHADGTGPQATQEIFRFLAPAQELDELGRLGPYRVLEVIGSGGMGVVFRAEDPHLKRTVALKALKRSPGAGEPAGKRFLREAQTVAALEHDHIVPIYHAGEDRGVLFLAMPLLNGETLDARLKREQRLPRAEGLRFAREVAEGIAAAHERGIVHRDVKPANVWLESGRDRVRLLDFGLARSVDDELELTQAGAIAGTPHYMSPEQARGGAITARCDLFSLGCVLYHMLAGRPPFRGTDTIATLVALADDPHTPLERACPGVPPGVSRLVSSLLAKRPEDRPASARAVAEEIARLEADMFRPPPRRWGVVLAAAAAALLAAGIVLTLATDRGTMVLTVNEPDVRVTVDGQPARYTITSPRDSIVIGLPSGRHALEVAKDGFTTYTQEFRVTRGGKEEFAVRLIPRASPTAGTPPNPPATAAPAPTPADHALPFVLTRAGGTEREEFKSLAGAIAVVRKGDEIVVHGNGPFRVPAVNVSGKGLVLHAAPGYRPRFVAAGPDGLEWFTVDGGPISISGCDFIQQTRNSLFVSRRDADPWEFRNCRFLKSTGSLFLRTGTGRITLENCLAVVVFHAYAPAVLLHGEGDGIEFVLRNSVLASLHRDGNALFELTGSGGALRLRNSTISGSSWISVNAGDGGRPLHVEATENVIQCDWALLAAGTAEADVRRRIAWSGRDNLYSVATEWFREPKPRGLQPGLAAWNQFWGREEPGSREVPKVAFRAADVERGGRDAVALLRERIAPFRGQADAAEVGPDWDLVGPGEPYVRALKAQGVAVSEERLRPEPGEFGPFTLVRAGKGVDSYPSLQQAVNAASTDDAIEIRGDGPFDGFALGQTPPRTLTLTVRAAPGYRPVVEGRVFIATGYTLSLEGIQFRDGTVGTSFGGSAQPWGRLARLTNCSFERRDPRPPEVVPLSCGWNTAHDPPIVIENTLIVGEQLNGFVVVGLAGAQKLIVRNSVIGTLHVIGPDEAEGRIELERCVACRRSPLNPLFILQPTGATGRVAVSARHTLFDAWFALSLRTKPGPIPFSWEGSHNVFAIPRDRWADDTDPTSSVELVLGLDEWRRRPNVTEEGSIETDPFCFAPSSWRLSTASSGLHALPDGKDIGADVDRVAVLAPGAGPTAKSP